MASPPHFNSSSNEDRDHFSDPPVASERNGVPILAAEELSTLSSSSASSSASRKIPPVPKFLPENSSMAGNPNSAPIERATPSPLSSSALLVRKLPPVPKFTSNDAFPMGPPAPKSTAPSRGLMGPPPVPKFESSSGEKKALGPPPVPKFHSSSGEKKALASSDGPQTSTDSPSESVEKLLSEEERPGSAAEVPIAEGGDAADLQGNDVSDVEETGRLSLSEGKRRALRLAELAEASSGSASSGQPPYVKPSWSAEPGHPYTMEILKEGNILGLVDVSKKGAYMFGRSERCDFLLEHPTVSRYHAVLQYNSDGKSFLYDLGSTHGTFINKLQVKGREYVPLHVGDIVRFGYSSRLHVFQGPLDLMPKEGLSKKERQERKLMESSQDRAIREASLIRARREASVADGISWGMQEDAEEEAEENVEEVTWQTFKGELTEKQQKTLGKIHKYNDKLSNLRKENDAIQAKEISQGGLTQGQQTQVARNEQRMEQLVEEVENLEETVNESIQESISGRTGVRKRGKKNPFDEEDEDDLSDDEFYDRASKGQTRKKEVFQKVETADSLLDQKAALMKEIENLREEIKAEAGNTPTSSQVANVANVEAETADPLDQFMTHLSSAILKDKASQLQKELDSLSKDLERVERLLKLADPTGEGLKKWELKNSAVGIQETSRIFPRKEAAQDLATQVADVTQKSDQVVSQEGMVDAGELKSDGNADEKTDKCADSEKGSVVLPGLEPALRLGAPKPEAVEEAMPEVTADVHEEAVNFVTYKERKKGIDSKHQATAADVVIEGEGQELSEKKTEEVSVVDLHIADSVALLLRQKRGLVEDSDPIPIPNVVDIKQSKRSSKKRKKQGPAMLPSSLDMDPSEDWVPPAGQTGDGRTSLNDKYGY